MNRSELVEQVAQATALEKGKAEDVVKAVIDTVIAETRSGEKVSIFGFGTFTPTARAARTGRNPQTGAPVKIKASKSVRFAPASAYKLSLNTRGGAKKTSAKGAAPAKKTAAAAKTAPTAKSVAPVKKTAPAAKKASPAKASPAKASPAKASPATTKAPAGKKAGAAKAAPAPAPAKASKKAVSATKATKSKSAKK